MKYWVVWNARGKWGHNKWMQSRAAACIVNWQHLGTRQGLWWLYARRKYILYIDRPLLGGRWQFHLQVCVLLIDWRGQSVSQRPWQGWIPSWIVFHIVGLINYTNGCEHKSVCPLCHAFLQMHLKWYTQVPFYVSVKCPSPLWEIGTTV